MIRPLTKAPKVKSISTYDFEWHPDLYEITLCGAYDERGYRKYPTIEHFILGELTAQNAGRTYYAHFGGASDMVFLLKPFLKDSRYTIRAIFSGSSAILVHIERGNLSWQFVDSYWTLRVPLAEIGSWLGFPKLKIDFRNQTPAELATYNERDCEILFKAMHRFQDAILASGGELGITAASTSMKTFLRKYLKRPIRNADFCQDFARRGYVASRVEPIREYCEDANYLDINSSFPFSMTMPCPGSPIGGGGRYLPSSGLYMAEISVTTPDDEYLPALPYRSDGRVFFPTGSFRTVVTQDDIEAGGFEINAVHKVIRFEERDDLREFANDFYALRQAGGFEGSVYKIVLNSLYGKFAERAEKQILIINPAERDVHAQGLLSLGIFIGEETTDVPHVHAPISAAITARSRRLLLEHLRAAASLGKVYYCDTDSVICDAMLPTSSELGGLKLEPYQIKRGRFVGSKLYAIEQHGRRDGEAEKDWKKRSKLVDREGPVDGPREPRELVKAKGFSRIVSEGGEVTPLTYEAFLGLSEGRSATIQRMMRIRELIRKEGADYDPQGVEFQKKLNLKIRPKRAKLPGNDSRPWRVDELPVTKKAS